MGFFLVRKATAALEPATWLPLKCEDQSRTAWVMCPRGHIGALSDHEIDAEGYVNPSVQCGELGCNFHEHIKLEEWTP